MKKKIKKASSDKQRLTAGKGYCRINLERNNHGHNTIEKNSGRSRRDSSTG